MKRILILLITNVSNEKANKKSILLPKQWKELKNLINQPNIVTKEAEKGGQSQLLVNTIIGQLFNTLTIKTNNEKYTYIWQYREKKENY